MHSFTPSSGLPDLSAQLLYEAESLTLIYDFERGERGDLMDWASFQQREACGGPFPREMGLWNRTCFESFISFKGREDYWELNFSEDGRWNCFYFRAYRSPQPPEPCFDLELVSFRSALSGRGWKGIYILKKGAALMAHPAQDLEYNLCAVLKSRRSDSGDTNFYALRHRDERPDFHYRQALRG